MNWEEIQKARNALKVGDEVLLPTVVAVQYGWNCGRKWGKTLYQREKIERVTIKTIVVGGVTYMRSTAVQRGCADKYRAPAFAVIGEKEESSFNDIVSAGAERDLRQRIIESANWMEKTGKVQGLAGLGNRNCSVETLKRLATLLDEVKLICASK